MHTALHETGPTLANGARMPALSKTLISAAATASGYGRILLFLHAYLLTEKTTVPIAHEKVSLF